MILSSNESYFICPECGALSTRTQIEAERENGGDGRCSCRYSDLSWNPKKNMFVFTHVGLMVDWTEIPWEVYDKLLQVPSVVIRLRAFESYDRCRKGGGKQDAD